jgi:integrase
LVALRWRDIDFAGSAIRVWGSYAKGALTKPKSGKARVVPMVPDVAASLARLGQREIQTGEDDLVFIGGAGSYLDASALRRRYVNTQKAAGLRPLRFHDLRHTFGSLAINRASIVQVQAWMGHADVDTTSRYLHHKSRADDADLLAGALRIDSGSGLRVIQDSSSPHRTPDSNDQRVRQFEDRQR